MNQNDQKKEGENQNLSGWDAPRPVAFMEMRGTGGADIGALEGMGVRWAQASLGGGCPACGGGKSEGGGRPHRQAPLPRGGSVIEIHFLDSWELGY